MRTGSYFAWQPVYFGMDPVVDRSWQVPGGGNCPVVGGIADGEWPSRDDQVLFVESVLADAV